MSEQRALAPAREPVELAFPAGWSERFWSRTEIVGDCIEWQGARLPRGYGIVCTKAIKALRAQDYAHRVAWMLDHGAIPAGLFICHRCDNPPCCNPAHLFLGTQSENLADMAAKGRAAKPAARLTPADVTAIRSRYAAGGVTLAQLGDEYGVCFQQVHRIVNRIRWKDVAA